MDHRYQCRCLPETLLWPVVMVISVIILFSCYDLPDSTGLVLQPVLQDTYDTNNGTMELQTMFSGTNIAGLEAKISSDDAFLRENDYEGEEPANRNISFSPLALNSSCGNGNREEVSLGLSISPYVNPTEEISDGLRRNDTMHLSSIGIRSSPETLPSDPKVPVELAFTNAKPAGSKDFTKELNPSLSPKKAENGELFKDNLSAFTPPAAPLVSEPKSSTVMTIPAMNNWLLHSLSFPLSMTPRWPSSADMELRNAKVQILNPYGQKIDPNLYAPLYRNLSMFQRSYELMEKMLKVYIYKEGAKPILHLPVLQGIYASEGWFMKLLVSSHKFVTRNPKEAHLFYLPFSSRNLEEKLYVPGSHSLENLVQYLKNYLDVIVTTHNFWNRSEGADHFLVACHDWAPRETSYHMSNCIRALCNSDIKEGFTFGKDVALPETLVRSPKHLQRGLGGKPASQRSILAFFAGNMHGYLRPLLLQHWGGKDPDMKIYARMPKTPKSMNYAQHMKSSKYCICARGYEVNSPRVVEAIFYECVPVIISDNFVPPFFSILKWESFAVFVLEKDIPNLKNILLAIPEERYLQLQMGVKRVQHHFIWHSKPVKYDIFHMILHSIWFSRVLRT